MVDLLPRHKKEHLGPMQMNNSNSLPAPGGKKSEASQKMGTGAAHPHSWLALYRLGQEAKVVPKL